MDMMQGAVTMRTMIMNKPILKNLRTLTIDSAHVRADGAAQRAWADYATFELSERARFSWAFSSLMRVEGPRFEPNFFTSFKAERKTFEVPPVEIAN